MEKLDNNKKIETRKKIKIKTKYTIYNFKHIFFVNKIIITKKHFETYSK